MLVTKEFFGIVFNKLRQCQTVCVQDFLMLRCDVEINTIGSHLHNLFHIVTARTTAGTRNVKISAQTEKLFARDCYKTQRP